MQCNGDSNTTDFCTLHFCLNHRCSAMAIVTQLIFVLSTFVSITVSTDVFKLVGSSVQLDIPNPEPEIKTFSWIFNTTDNVLEYYKQFKHISPSSDYKDRVEFNSETYSLTLKNVQKNDSGLYEAKATGKKIAVVAEYTLSVFDPAAKPVLIYQKNTTTCNITLTCRGHDYSISSNCNNETCEEKTETLPGGFMLSLFVNGSSIICNHSNPASWNKTVVEMKTFTQLCVDSVGMFQNQLYFSWPLYTILGGILVIFIIFLAYKSQHSTSADLSPPENAVYAEVDMSGAASPPNTVLEMPCTVYNVIQKKPKPSSNGKDSEIAKTQEGVPISSTVEHPKPETIYATVSKPSKAVNVG